MSDDAPARLYQAFVNQDPAAAIGVIERAKRAGTAQVQLFVIPPTTSGDTGVTVLLGAMHHDHHTIDKDITAAALKEAGNRVIDLGADVRPADFLERAEESGARILIVFAQLVGVAHSVSRVREMFSAGGRSDITLLVAGGPFIADPMLARSVGIVRGAESALKLVAKAAARQGTAS